MVIEDSEKDQVQPFGARFRITVPNGEYRFQ